MPRISTKLVLEAMPRIVALLVLWDYVPKLLTITSSLYAISSLLEIPNLLALVTSVLAILTIVTASPLLYSLTLILMVISSPQLNIVSIASIAGLIALLTMDTLRFTYRPRQRVKIYGFKGLLISLVPIAVSMIILCSFPAKFVTTIVQGLVSYIIQAPNTILRLLGENVVFKIVLSIAFTAAIYVLLVEAFDVLALFVAPSKEVSLRALTDRSILNIVVEEPLRWLKSLILASFIAPPLYAVVMRGFLPLLSVCFPRLYLLIQSKWGSIVLAIATYLLSILLMRGIIKYVHIDPKRTLGASLTLIALIYLSGVALTYVTTWSLMYSLLNPNIKLVSEIMARTYVDFYTQFFYILEDLLRMIGVAP